MNTTQTTGFTGALRRIARGVAGPLGALASLSTLAIMVAIVIDVIVRNASNRSVPGLLEASETALVATVFLGLAYAGATNAHVAVDLLTEALQPRVARVLIGVAWVIGVLITAWLVLATFERAMESTEAGELRQGLVDWPLWPARWLVVIGLAAFLLVAVINVILIVRGEPVLGEDEPDPDLAAAHEARLEERLKHHPGHRAVVSPEAEAYADGPGRSHTPTHRPEGGRS